MAISTGAALLGSAIIGAGAGAINSGNAAKKAANASQYATDQSTQLQREALNTQQANTATARAGGDAAINQLMSRLGLGPPGAASSASPQAGSPDWGAVRADRPDVAAAISDPNGGFNGANDDAKTADWYNRYGAASGYQAPTVSGAAPTNDVQLSPAAQVPATTRPASLPAPTPYGQAAAPQASASQAQPRTAGATNMTGANNTGQNPAASDYAARYMASNPNASALPSYDELGSTAGFDLSDPSTYQYDNNGSVIRSAAEQAYTNGYTIPGTTGDAYMNDWIARNTGSGNQGGGSGSNGLNIGLDAYQASPDYNYQQSEAARAVKANAAATIGLNSGAAIKALQDRSQNIALGDYGQWRDYTTGQFNTDRARNDQVSQFNQQLSQQDRQFGANYNQNAYQYGQNRADNIFNTDRAYSTDLALNNRNYETGRYDNTTNALFNLANLGQGAASQYGAAVQNGANNSSNALFSNAANQGNAALTNANNLNSLIGGGVNALAYYYGNKSPSAALASTSGASGWESWMGA